MAQRRGKHELNQAIETHLAAAQAAGQCLSAKDRVSRARLEARVQAGQLVRPAADCYVSPEVWASLDAAERSLWVMRTIQRKHRGYVFCGESAAIAWGLYEPRDYLARPYVATSLRSHSPSSRFVERRFLPEELDVCSTAAINVTTLERTAFDAARFLGFRRGLGVCDQALAKSGLSSQELLDEFTEMGPSRGCAVARKCAKNANSLSENGGESFARAVMIEEGFVAPLLQVPIIDPFERGNSYRTDYFWLLDSCDARRILNGLRNGTLPRNGAAGCIAGELDGWGKTFDERITGTRSAQEMLLAERRREARLTWYGIRVVRFSFAEVCRSGYLANLLGSYGVPRVQK